MKLSSLLSAFALSTLGACVSVGNVTEDNFAEKSAQLGCKMLEKCNRGYFESEYSDQADCIDELEEDTEDMMDAADDADCDFEEDEAQKCLDTFAASTCEEYYEGDAWDDCEDIFDC